MTHRLLSVPLVALLATACGLDEVDVRAHAEETIDGAGPLSAVPLTLSFSSFTSIDVARELRENDASLDDIDSARLRSLRLGVDGAGSSFDTFLDRIEFFVRSADGQREELVADAVGPFPAGARSIDCRVVPVELKPYAQTGVVSITTRVTGNLPALTTTLAADAVIRVDVDVSNFIGL